MVERFSENPCDTENRGGEVFNQTSGMMLKSKQEKITVKEKSCLTGQPNRGIF
jgi:hypothetical protein